MRKILTLFLASVLFSLLAISLAMATTESTKTTINMNVATVVAYTLTLPGVAAVESTAAGASTSSIECNSTDGTDFGVQPKVIGGNSQTSANAIYQFDNIGSVKLNYSVNISVAMPSCMNLTGNGTYANVNTTEITTTLLGIKSDHTPAAAAFDFWLMCNFNNCIIADATTRTIYTFGNLTD